MKQERSGPASSGTGTATRLEIEQDEEGQPGRCHRHRWTCPPTIAVAGGSRNHSHAV